MTMNRKMAAALGLGLLLSAACGSAEQDLPTDAIKLVDTRATSTTTSPTSAVPTSTGPDSRALAAAQGEAEAAAAAKAAAAAEAKALGEKIGIVGEPPTPAQLYGVQEGLDRVQRTLQRLQTEVDAWAAGDAGLVLIPSPGCRETP